MTPASAEIAGHLVHFVTEGHSVHEHVEHTENKEHGCSGPYHMCVCHTTVVFVVAKPSTEASPSIENAEDIPLADQGSADGHRRAVFRPPIA